MSYDSTVVKGLSPYSPEYPLNTSGSVRAQARAGKVACSQKGSSDQSINPRVAARFALGRKSSIVSSILARFGRSLAGWIAFDVL